MGNIESNTVYFVGSGPGDPSLITLKAKELLENADVIVYSGSLLNPKLLMSKKQEAMLYDAAVLDRERIYKILRDSTKNGKLAIRFHDGDPALFSAIREQIDKLELDGIKSKVIPGVTALLAAAAAMNLELTLPGNTQTVIITRAELRTPVPDKERISDLARHGSTMALYLSVHLIERVAREMIVSGSYTKDTPAAVVYRASWDDQKIITGTLGDIASKTRRASVMKTAVIIVGDVIAPKKYEFSKVYDSGFSHGFRTAKT